MAGPRWRLPTPGCHSTPVLAPFWQVQTLCAAQVEFCWNMTLKPPVSSLDQEPSEARQLRCRELSIFPFTPSFALHDVGCVCFTSISELAATRALKLHAYPDPGTSSDSLSGPLFPKIPAAEQGISWRHKALGRQQIEAMQETPESQPCSSVCPAILLAADAAQAPSTGIPPLFSPPLPPSQLP